MNRKLRWGIVGTGGIAAKFAKDLPKSLTGELVGVASRTVASAEAFARDHHVPRAYGSYEALFRAPEVEAVYIATPHPQHLENALLALELGKHVLCEKPLTLNGAQAGQLIDAARRGGRTLMEAFMYRCHPQTARIVEMVRNGELGKVELMQASFSYHFPYDPASRAWNPALGGGGILDVGVYPVSMARLVAGAVAGKSFEDPLRIDATGRLSPDGIDAHATALLTFSTGFAAQVSCGVGMEQDNRMRLYGTKGWIDVPAPWVPSFTGPAYSIFKYTSQWSPAVEETASAERPIYALEADAFGRSALAGKLEVPEMSWGDTLGNFAVTDAWRKAIGVSYPGE